MTWVEEDTVFGGSNSATCAAPDTIPAGILLSDGYDTCDDADTNVGLFTTFV